ncbi:MAG TPA: branched-chain amino acid ABC transporter permease [Candidatus Baltobacteraceae bacterium]|jgi:branched-chain amino acid transport system permease protein
MKRTLDTVGMSILAIVLLGMPLWMNVIKLNVSLGTSLLLFGLAAASVNILVGYTGFMAFGNAAFFGVGAYGSALFSHYILPDNMILATIVGALTGTLSAFVLAPFLIRRRGIYFALLTVAFGQVYYFIAYRWSNVTGGEDGFSISRPHLFGPQTNPMNGPEYYYYVLVVFVAVMVFLWFLVRSPFGLSLRAISQNEVRVRYLAINSDRLIFKALVISGMVAGIAGSLYSMSINFAYPLLMDWHQSGDFVMMTILGGAGTLWGPFIGAIIYTLAANVLSSKTETWQIMIGALFVICVLFFPKGILGFLSRPTTTSEDVDTAPSRPRTEQALAQSEQG